MFPREAGGHRRGMQDLSGVPGDKMISRRQFLTVAGAGAIFIKRSFQDNELYKITLRHYIGYLMEKRFPMNWAFEGLFLAVLNYE